jgi:hypothetical protein
LPVRGEDVGTDRATVTDLAGRVVHGSIEQLSLCVGEFITKCKTLCLGRASVISQRDSFCRSSRIWEGRSRTERRSLDLLAMQRSEEIVKL